MNETTRRKLPDFQELPKLTFRQLEVFCVVCREASFANAALELRSTRSNIKRVCEDFEEAVGRPLFVEGPERTLQPTAFAKALLAQTGPLSRGLHHLGESVRSLHKKGRILRFAAAGEFFKGGLFTDFLARLQISDSFRPCFLRIETNRFRTALLNSECDVYFGAGIAASDRLEIVNLGPIPWSIKAGANFRGKPPTRPADLPAGKWCIAEAGDPEVGAAVLEEFHAAGAVGGRVLKEGSASGNEILLSLATSSTGRATLGPEWPCYRFSAVLKKHHPYSELMPRLAGAALV
jgi:DNA-binding transcriptional LysR family regulator